MKRQTAKPDAQTFSRRFSKSSFLLFLAFLGTIAQVGLSIYLPILIGQVIDQVLVAGSSPVFLADFSPDALGGNRKYSGTMGQSSLYNRLIFLY